MLPLRNKPLERNVGSKYNYGYGLMIRLRAEYNGMFIDRFAIDIAPNRKIDGVVLVKFDI